ncbi:putative membrane protein [Arthrobacter sp. CAN_A6]
MTGTGNRVMAVVFIGLELLAVAAVPFLVIPAVVAGSWVLVVRLRTTHAGFSRAWRLAGLSAGLLAAAVTASMFAAPPLIVSVLLLLGFISYAGTVVLFGLFVFLKIRRKQRPMPVLWKGVPHA